MTKDFNKKSSGFTLAELLIVVAIIAVLVAVSIPLFTNRLESSREATDVSNLRSAYAAGVAEALADSSAWDKNYVYTTAGQLSEEADAEGITGKASIEDWQGNEPDFPAGIEYEGYVEEGNTINVHIDDEGNVTAAFE